MSLLLLLAARDTKEDDDDDDDDDENDEAGPNRTAECREGVTKAAVGSTAELTDQRHQTTKNRCSYLFDPTRHSIIHVSVSIDERSTHGELV